MKDFNKMNRVDLEKYKDIWKNEKSFDEKKLSANEISKFLRSSSKSIVELFRKGLIIDVLAKTILLISMIVLFLLIPDQLFFNFIHLFIAIIIISGLIWQVYILRKIPSYITENRSVIQQLREYIRFYYKYYISSVYVGALSATMFFLIGSIYYLYTKYHKLPPLQIDDYIVMSVGVLLSYGLSFIVQLKHYNYRVRQLEECLTEVENETITKASIKQNINRKKWTIAFATALIVGLIFLLFLIINLSY